MIYLPHFPDLQFCEYGISSNVLIEFTILVSYLHGYMLYSATLTCYMLYLATSTCGYMIYLTGYVLRYILTHI